MSHVRYEELNVRSLETVRSYHEDVPTFVRNRPPFFLQHCLKRLPTSSDIRKEHITSVTSGVYIVKRPEQREGHEVQLRNPADVNVPFCDCMDWKRHCLPCKHILAVIMLAEGCSGWDSLPEYYRCIPQFNLDPLIAPTGVCTDGQMPDTVPVSDGHIADTESSRPLGSSVQPETSGASSVHSKVRQTLYSLSELTYVIDDTHFLHEQLQQLQQQVDNFKKHTSTRQKKVLFRIGRRTVRKNVRASLLRRRLATVRARRAAKRKQRMQRKTKLSG